MTVSQIRLSGNGSRYIAVEGPIGVGKTALGRRLARACRPTSCWRKSKRTRFSNVSTVTGRSAALPAQMFFLFARARQIEAMRQSDLFSSTRISDYLFTRDRLFAELNLDAEELKLYEADRRKSGCRCTGAGPGDLPCRHRPMRMTAAARAA